MTFHYDLDPKIRFIVLYQDAQMKPTRISKLIGIPLRTVYDWIQKLEDDIDILEHQSKNFSQKIDDQTRMDITNDAKEPPSRAITRKLGARYDLSHTAVRDVLLNERFEFRKPEKKNTLTGDEMEDRVLYCKDMLKYKASKIKRCLFSDEMGIRLTKLYKPKKLWMLPHAELNEERIDQDVKVNCWGAISWNGATSLHIFSQNLKNPLY